MVSLDPQDEDRIEEHRGRWEHVIAVTFAGIVACLVLAYLVAQWHRGWGDDRS